MNQLASPDVLALLQRISDQLDALPKAMAKASHQGSSLTRQDRECLRRLLPRISTAVGSAAFTMRDLLDEAAQDDDLMGLIVQTFGPVGSGAARKLGKLFTRSHGFAEEGIRVESAGKVRDGVLWRVLRD